ncbi:hypothetical protein KP509_02G008600 [Ceratopteris richardii]|nr:hypothetical protein KP509_02G008600 [Ceratopteris richardii]
MYNNAPSDSPCTKGPDFDGQVPQAELCGVDKQCVSAQDLDSPVALMQWLQDRLPSSSAQQIFDWGKIPATKNVTNLWVELSQGEISLEDAVPPKRTVHVVIVNITNGSGKMLLEAYQEMTDGSIRERNRPLSEKMKLGENVEHACLRGIREELGKAYGADHYVQMLPHTYKKEIEERHSSSYPGLMTCYILHHMTAIMKHLPVEDFVTVENEYLECSVNRRALDRHVEETAETVDTTLTCSHETPVGVRRHFWKWVPETTTSLAI